MSWFTFWILWSAVQVTKTTKRNVMLQLVLGRTLCSVINLIAKTHFQHVKTSGRVVQKPIPVKLMRATVTVTIIVLEIWDAELQTVGPCIQAIPIVAKKKVDTLWSGMTLSLKLWQLKLNAKHWKPSSFLLTKRTFYFFWQNEQY